MATIKIRDGAGNMKEIGQINEGIFYKKVNEERHLYNLLDAWAIDLEAFESIISKQCTQIRILEESSDTVYVCTPEDFTKFGETKTHPPHRAQIFLERKFFKREAKRA